MTPRTWQACVVLALGALLSGCGEDNTEVAASPPVTVISQDDVGHYCGMFLFEHKGPKGQIRLRDQDAPVWFTTIREVFAYIQLPEEPKTITGAYVQDMSRMLPDETFPDDAWIDARASWYVIYSRYAGGMGTLDSLPFSTQEAAQAFSLKEGGHVVHFNDMPEDYIFGLPELTDTSEQPKAGVPSSAPSHDGGLPAGVPQ